MKGKSFLIGFLLGGVSAGISTLLTAPKSGVETRNNLKESKEVVLHQLNDLKDHLKELNQSLIAASSEGTETLKDFVLEIKHTVSNWQQEIKPHQRELQRELAEIEQSIQELESELSKK
ncbi:YtxH domain-containing protein [Niallia endozanthoxylica]|uniref:YtxH domain-containing protein n=1 Tax=Niallia endozanthoxylica TaxID=2036016 RepID=A0A5J5I755_9BACI|nr:YtxH domain-containing protein [Niallia endozanthoxylica]KAA9031650.1 YtxH domain-containing protein [Niallia endozanthoxylica]